MIKLGQISNQYNKYSTKLDYLQFDICGLGVDEVNKKALKVLENAPNIKGIILHSDWSKRGCSENNFPYRYKDYINISKELSKYFNIIGITLHPMFRSKISDVEFLSIYKELNKEVPTFIENRSNHKILFSKPDEVIDLSQKYTMTIDIPQLYISCGYNKELFLDTLKGINWCNVKEIHLANLKVDGNRTYVGRSIDDGVLDIEKIKHYLKDKYITLEILGGIATFERNKEIIYRY